MNIKKNCLNSFKFYISRFLIMLLLFSISRCLNSVKIFADCGIPEPDQSSKVILIIMPGFGVKQDGFSKSFNRSENKKLEATKIKEDTGEKEEHAETLQRIKEKLPNALLVSKIINKLLGPNPDLDITSNGNYTGFEIYVPRIFYTNNKDEIDKVLNNDCRAFSEKLPLSKYLHIIDVSKFGRGRDNDDDMDGEFLKEIISFLNGSKQNSSAQDSGREIIVLSVRHEGDTNKKSRDSFYDSHNQREQDNCVNAYILGESKSEKEFYKNSLFLADALTKNLNGTNCIHQREGKTKYNSKKYNPEKNNKHVISESENNILKSCDGYKNVSAVMLECPSIANIEGAIASMNHANQDDKARKIADTLQNYFYSGNVKEYSKKHFEAANGDKKATVTLKISGIPVTDKIKTVRFAIWHESVEPGKGAEEWVEANLVDKKNGTYSIRWAPERGLCGNYFVHTYVYFKDEKGNEKKPVFVTSDSNTFEYGPEQINAVVEAGSEDTVKFTNITSEVNGIKVPYYVKGDPDTPRWATEITKLDGNSWKVKLNDKRSEIVKIDLHGVIAANGKNFKMAEFITNDNGNSFLSVIKNTPN